MTTKPKAPARERMVTSAHRLMLAQGYTATAVDQICEDAGVSKGSFYHSFPSKEALGLAALNHYYEQGIARVMSGPFMNEADPMKRLFRFLKQTESQAKEIWGDGCLLGSFAVDLAETNSAIRERVAAQFDQITSALSELFKPIAAHRNVKLTSRELAASYLAALEGSIVMARAFDDPSRITAGLKSFRLQMEEMKR